MKSPILYELGKLLPGQWGEGHKKTNLTDHRLQAFLNWTSTMALLLATPELGLAPEGANNLLLGWREVRDKKNRKGKANTNRLEEDNLLEAVWTERRQQILPIKQPPEELSDEERQKVEETLCRIDTACHDYNWRKLVEDKYSKTIRKGKASANSERRSPAKSRTRKK